MDPSYLVLPGMDYSLLMELLTSWTTFQNLSKFVDEDLRSKKKNGPSLICVDFDT